MMKEPMGKHNRLVRERAEADYDYVIVDSHGRRGVKDGKEIAIDEEEWQKAHPEHRKVDCKECTFVQDKDILLLYVVSREARERATTKPSFVGKFTMIGWTGHSGFYLFKCPDCDKVCVDYPHGYRDGGYLYIQCGGCLFEIILSPKKYKEVYERDNVPVPKEFTWRSFFGLIRLARKFAKWRSDEEFLVLRKPLNIEDQEKLKIKSGTVIPSDLES